MKPFYEHPTWVQELMLTRQVEQGNERNPDVFKEKIDAMRLGGGFSWSMTKEGEGVWCHALDFDDYSGLIEANPGIDYDKPIHYTVSYDKNKRFILKKDKALNSKELSLITATLHAAGHKNIQIEQGVPPTPTNEEETKC